MPLDDETAARFDHMMLPLAQQVAAMAHRVLVLRDGCIVADGPPERVLRARAEA